MRNSVKLLFLAIPLLFLSSCHTTKTVQSTQTPETHKFDVETYKQQVASFSQKNRFVTAKLSMAMNAGSKNISVSGSLKMKRDDVIQLSLTFLGLEIGRMEFTPQEVLILDRFNKQYVRTTYDKVSFLKDAQLNFSSLQALFWNNLFVPGKASAVGQTSRFTTAQTGNQMLLTLPDAPQLTYTFLTNMADARILRTNITGKDVRDKTELEWTYADFTPLAGQNFPSHMVLTIKGLRKSYSLDMSLSRLDTKSDWETRTEVPQKYKQRSVNDITRQIFSL